MSRLDRPSTPILVGTVVACLVAVGVTGYLTVTLTRGDPAASPKVMAQAAPPTPITYWPSASNTGVPPGTVLRDSGGLNLRTDGQHVTGLNITGCVNVYARNVRITRSRINCGSPAYAVRTMSTAVNLVIEDVEIDGLNRNAVAICCNNYTARRVNMHGMIDGPRLGDNVAVVDSYIHDLARLPRTHNDTLQTTGGVSILVQHNTLQVYDPVTGDPMNACLMVGSEQAPEVRDLLFVDNYCDGGNYSIGIRPDMTAVNMLFQRNKFGRNYRYGVVARPVFPGLIWECSNVWFDNGLPVAP